MLRPIVMWWRRTSWIVLLWACTGSAPEAPRTAASQVPSPTPQQAQPGVLLMTAQAQTQPQADGFEACVSTGTIEASLRPTNLLFLIDRSASMSCNLPPIQGSAQCEAAPARVDSAAPSKWEVVNAALQRAIGQLPAAARVGISFFSNDDRCGVQSEPSVSLAALDATHVGALQASLDAVNPKGGTPIVGGLILAYKHLNPDQNPALTRGNRVVVLLTDGQEGCAVDQVQRLLTSELPKSRSAGIMTFVIGVPGSESNRSFLSELAFAGGTASRPDCAHGAADPSLGDCHFDMTRNIDLAADLARALAAVSGQALSCEFELPAPAGGEELDRDKVNVVY
jgi:hypothetical protein